MKEPTLTEIAARIDAHLKRFEADPVIDIMASDGLPLFYHAAAVQVGGFVSLTYRLYQNGARIRRDRALAYLEWLDAGNIGKHYDFERMNTT